MDVFPLPEFAEKENIKQSAVTKFLSHYEKFIKLANEEEREREGVENVKSKTDSTLRTFHGNNNTIKV